MMNKNLLFFLIIIHVFITTLSNALVAIPLNIFDFKITWAALIFPLVVVATDLTVRLVGKKIAQKTILFSYPFAIISSILVVYFEGNLFSVAFRIGIASATAYALGMTIDIFAFVGHPGRPRHRKIRYFWQPGRTLTKNKKKPR